MSDCIVKIIPADPFMKISMSSLNEAKIFLEENVPCDFVEINVSDSPEFVDCGADLEKISCPKCGKDISLEWWGEAMDAASESSFCNLTVYLPCCSQESSLNDLNYHFRCGFSCSRIEIYNPKELLENKIMNHIKSILGVDIIMISAYL